MTGTNEVEIIVCAILLAGRLAGTALEPCKSVGQLAWRSRLALSGPAVPGDRSERAAGLGS